LLADQSHGGFFYSRVTRKGQIGSTRISEELKIFKLNNDISKSRLQWKYHVPRMEGRRIPKEILKYNPKRRQDIGSPQLKWGDQHTLQEEEEFGWKRPLGIPMGRWDDNVKMYLK
jgi:hypothetical protein